MDSALALIKYVLRNIRSGYRTHVNNIQFILLLITIILLCNDIAENLWPEHSWCLTIFHLNCRSVRNKLNDILNYIESCDIICLTETHLDAMLSTVPVTDLILEGFVIWNIILVCLWCRLWEVGHKIKKVGLKNMTLWKMKINAFEFNKMSVLIRFLWKYDNYVWVRKKMCCISKLQIERDFWPVNYLIHELQKYKT